MKNLLIAIVLVAAVVAGIGFYRGWFQVSTADADHKSNVTFSVDQEKLHDDEQKLKDMGHSGSAHSETPGDANSRP